MTKVIFINGAPRSGKDTAGEILQTYINNEHRKHHAVRFKFAEPLKQAAHCLFGQVSHAAYFENFKDHKLDAFHGMTPREVYIKLSEEFVKPNFSEDFFGQVCVSRIKRKQEMMEKSTELTTLITDSGFESEAKPVMNFVGVENCLLVRVLREGTSFQGDSRSHVQLNGVRTISVDNNGTVGDFQDNLIKAVAPWFNRFN